MRKTLIIFMVFSLIIASISPGVMAQDDAVTEFLKRRIKIVPVRSNKEIKTSKNPTFTTTDMYGYFTVQTQTGGGETVEIDPSSIEDFEAYQGGRELDDIELLETVGEYRRAQEIENARQKNTIGALIGGVGGVVSLIGMTRSLQNPDEVNYFNSLTIGGLAGGVLGLIVAPSSSSLSLSFHEAAQLASIHNRELMNELDLSKEDIREVTDNN